MAVLLNRAPARAWRRIGQIAGCWYAVVIAASATVTARGLETGTATLWPSWLLQTRADHACVMCGLTRSFAAMSHGEFARAAEYHAAGPALYGAMLSLACWAAVSIAVDVRRGRRDRRPAGAHGR